MWFLWGCILLIGIVARTAAMAELNLLDVGVDLLCVGEVGTVNPDLGVALLRVVPIRGVIGPVCTFFSIFLLKYIKEDVMEQLCRHLKTFIPKICRFYQ